MILCCLYKPWSCLVLGEPAIYTDSELRNVKFTLITVNRFLARGNLFNYVVLYSSEPSKIQRTLMCSVFFSFPVFVVYGHFKSKSDFNREFNFFFFLLKLVFVV